MPLSRYARTYFVDELVELVGRGLVKGRGRGRILITTEPISFYGGVDPETGRIVERGHELYGECVSGSVLVFPYGKGSTVGSYTLLRLARKGLAPAGIVNAESEPIIVVGCLIGGIPLMDRPTPDPFSLKGIINGLEAEIVVEGSKGVVRVQRDARGSQRAREGGA